MNRERAETFLRVLAETELREVLAHLDDGTPQPDGPQARPEAADVLRRPAAAAMLGMLPAR